MATRKRDPSGIVDTERLMAAAEEVGFSKADIARLLHVSPSTVSGYGRPGKDGLVVAAPFGSRQILWDAVNKRRRRETAIVEGQVNPASMYDDLTDLIQGGVSEDFRTLYTAIVKALKDFKVKTPGTAPRTPRD